MNHLNHLTPAALMKMNAAMKMYGGCAAGRIEICIFPSSNQHFTKSGSMYVCVQHPYHPSMAEAVCVFLKMKLTSLGQGLVLKNDEQRQPTNTSKFPRQMPYVFLLHCTSVLCRASAIIFTKLYLPWPPPPLYFTRGNVFFK